MGKRLFCLSRLAICVALCGCDLLPSHFHDADRASRTDKLLTELNDNGQQSSSIYDQLIADDQNLATQQDIVLSKLFDSRGEAFADLLPFYDGIVLKKKSDNLTAALVTERATLAKAVDDYLQAKNKNAVASKDQDAAIAKAQTLVATAQAQVDNWNATIALLNKGIADAAAPSSKETATGGISNLANQINSIGGQAITYVDSSGTQTTQSIKDYLTRNIDLSKLGASGIQIADAPGATVAILSLGLNLAQIQKDTTTLELAELSKRLSLYERVNSELQIAEALLKDTDGITPDGTAFDVEAIALAVEANADEKDVYAAAQDHVKLYAQLKAKASALPTTMPSSSKPAISDTKAPPNKINDATVAMNLRMDSLTLRLIAIQKFAVAESVITRTSLDLDRSQARLNHEEALIAFKQNDLAWQAVIRSGLTVLNQYEQGGFTSENAATIVQIAQTVALGVIAGRV
jgi:predicted transcriptional regulator YheO